MKSLVKNEIKYYRNQKPLTYEDYNELKTKNLKYTDDIFPPSIFSLISCDANGIYYDKIKGEEKAKQFLKKNEYKDIIWERISDMPEYNEIYNKEFSYESIMQGTIGDCYLISALCALSQYPKLIINDKENSINIIHNQKYAEVGYFEIKLFIDGEYQIVIIDDYIPYDQNLDDIAFVKSSKNFFWVLLVEKAIAKVFGGYSNIENDKNGNNSDKNENELLSRTNLVFQMLTGFVPEYFYFDNEYNKEHYKNEIFSKEEIYNKLYYDGLYQNKNKIQFLITSGTLNEDEGILEENYMPYNHSFSILDIKTVILNDDKSEVKLLLLNNPWGKNIYNSELFGKYKYNPNNKNMADLNKYIHYNMNSKDGTFWIDFDTFYESFSYVSLCKIIPNSKIKIYKFEDEIFYKKPLIFNLIVENDETEINFSIHLKRNVYEVKQYLSYCYLIINKYDENKKIIEAFSLYEYTRDINKSFTFNKGKYALFVYMPEKYHYNKNEKMINTLKIIHNKDIAFDFIKFDDNFSYLMQSIKNIFYLKDKNINTEINNNKKDIFSKIEHNILDGFAIIFLKNKTNKKFKLDYTLILKNYEILNSNFQKNSEEKYTINDKLCSYGDKFYICINNNKNAHISGEYKYIEKNELNNNESNVFDNSFFKFEQLKNEENIKNNKIKIFEYFSPEYYKIDRKIYEKMKYYDSDNLIHDFKTMNNSDNTKREIRSIENEDNIHTFGNFSKKYQNSTYSKDNLHGFENKKNNKLSIHNENNKYFMKNDTNSGYNFNIINDKDKNSIFENKIIMNEDNKINNTEENKIHEELNDRKHFYNYIDYMFKIEKKANQNANYTETLNKYKSLWNKMKDEEKIIYVFLNLLEQEKIININEIIE